MTWVCPIISRRVRNLSWTLFQRPRSETWEGTWRIIEYSALFDIPNWEKWLVSATQKGLKCILPETTSPILIYKREKPWVLHWEQENLVSFPQRFSVFFWTCTMQRSRVFSLGGYNAQILVNLHDLKELLRTVLRMIEYRTTVYTYAGGIPKLPTYCTVFHVDTVKGTVHLK